MDRERTLFHISEALKGVEKDNPEFQCHGCRKVAEWIPTRLEFDSYHNRWTVTGWQVFQNGWIEVRLQTSPPRRVSYCPDCWPHYEFVREALKDKP